MTRQPHAIQLQTIQKRQPEKTETQAFFRARHTDGLLNGERLRHPQLGEPLTQVVPKRLDRWPRPRRLTPPSSTRN